MNADLRNTLSTAKVGVNYKFNWGSNLEASENRIFLLTTEAESRANARDFCCCNPLAEADQGLRTQKEGPQNRESTPFE